MAIHRPRPPEGQPPTNGIRDVEPRPHGREDGQFIVDRYGRRLLDNQGRFLVHDSTAAPCCGGCPWGVSIQGPDHPGDDPNNILYNEIEISDYWLESPVIGGIPTINAAYFRTSGYYGPGTHIGVRLYRNSNIRYYGLSGAAYINAWTHETDPEHLVVYDESHTDNYYIADAPFVVVPDETWDHTIYNHAYLIAGTKARIRVEAIIPSHIYPQQGLNASLSHCAFASELAAGIQPEATRPLVFPGVGQRYIHDSQPFGPDIWHVCDGYPGYKGGSVLSARSWVAWPIYKHLYTNYSSGMLNVRVTAHGTRPYNSWWQMGTHTSRGITPYSVNPTTLGYTGTDPYEQPSDICRVYEWSDTVTITCGHETPSYYLPGHWIMLDITPAAISGRGLPCWCVIDEVEVL